MGESSSGSSRGSSSSTRTAGPCSSSCTSASISSFVRVSFLSARRTEASKTESSCANAASMRRSHRAILYRLDEGAVAAPLDASANAPLEEGASSSALRLRGALTFCFKAESTSSGLIPLTENSLTALAWTSPPHFNPSATRPRFRRSSPKAARSSADWNCARSIISPSAEAEACTAHSASNFTVSASTPAPKFISGRARWPKSTTYASACSTYFKYED
mmetsp:Transcript_28741/g.96854  ORF Transcript_28741/g.96854 Transcript_28741/m.96854 type:complete len:219 (+) Transcript_28741:447-1103(+)